MRERGIVVTWDRTFGFIRADAGGRDVFAHYTAIVESDDAFRELQVGARVTFARGTDPSGRECAVFVQVEGAA
jgi:cold shock CspA family protein